MRRWAGQGGGCAAGRAGIGYSADRFLGLGMDWTGFAERFERDGFAAARGLFSRAEAARLKAEGQRIVREVSAEAEARGEDVSRLFPAGVCVGLAQRSGVLYEAVADGRLLDGLSALLGPDIRFLSDKVCFKDERKVFDSPWHQDWSYWGNDHKVSVWVALDDARRENGALKLIPGSHRGHVTHDGDASDGHGFGHRLDPSNVDESLAVTPELEAGGALFFHDLTLHASHPNAARADRWVWIPTYHNANGDEPLRRWGAARVVRGAVQGDSGS